MDGVHRESQFGVNRYFMPSQAPSRNSPLSMSNMKMKKGEEAVTSMIFPEDLAPSLII